MDSLVETVSLYTDDTLLYLEDTGSSLQIALQTIEEFGKHSGLRINWFKSQILPIDHFPPTNSSASLPLHRVSSIKYLGIKITREPLDYIKDNIEPLFTYLKTSTQSWSRLPLGVMGRINLTKIILLPKFLYVFWHSLVLIPLKTFKTQDSILNAFIWGSSRHKWNTLKNPSSLGGAALPDFHLLHSFPTLPLLSPPQNRRI